MPLDDHLLRQLPFPVKRVVNYSLEKGSQLKNNPLVSIIIPQYNTAKYAAENLDSVFNQTFRDFEVITINDGAPDTDELTLALKPYQEKIIYVSLEKNSGTSAARNIGASIAGGQILAFLDADDIWHPQFLEKMTGFMLDGGFDLAYSSGKSFYNLSKIEPSSFRVSNPAKSGLVTRSQLFSGQTLILPSGTLLRREAFEKIGGFDTEVLRSEDYDLWYRLACAGARFGYLREDLFHFRITPDSGSGTLIERYERSVRLYNKVLEKLPITESEKTIVKRLMQYEKLAATRARAKTELIRGDWELSREYFKEALDGAASSGLPFTHQLRLKLLIFLTKFFPSAARWFFLKFRTQEAAIVIGHSRHSLG
jgi:glycosyltransferase involved in cell wall biosynthesis